MGEPLVAPPYVLAMIICDSFWRDPGSGKFTILGTYSTIGAMAFPAQHRALCVYFAMTDGRGSVPIKVRLVDANEELPPIFEAENPMEFTDPRAVHEGVIVIGNPVFPAPGEYRLQLFGGTEPMMERRVLLVDVSKQGRADGE